MITVFLNYTVCNERKRNMFYSYEVQYLYGFRIIPYTLSVAVSKIFAARLPSGATSQQLGASVRKHK